MSVQHKKLIPHFYVSFPTVKSKISKKLYNPLFPKTAFNKYKYCALGCQTDRPYFSVCFISFKNATYILLLEDKKLLGFTLIMQIKY